MTSTPTLTVYHGIGTIGGTKIAVAEGGYQVIFDFGSTYAPGGDFWGGKIRSRPGAAHLRDMITLGYTPALDDLYRPDAAAAVGLKPGGDGKTHIFISHLHLDHMALVDLLADEVPVWMHHDALRLFRAVETTGEGPAVPAGARGFDWGQPIHVGPIKVTPVAVDHDIPGASALLIETSAGTVVYTGDLRRHGANPERIDAFIAAARATNPKILLIEGTRLGEAEFYPDRAPTLRETEVPGKVLEHLAECTGLGMITVYPRNTLRVENLAAAVPAAGRLLALSPEMAYIYTEMGGDLERVVLYLRAKDQDALAAGTAPAWLAGLLERGVRTVDSAALRAEPARYLLQLFYWDLPELVDLQPPQGSVFIHSNGEPLGRFDPAYDLLVRWLQHFEVPMAYAQSTGHASEEDLLSIVRGVGAEVLMPIHSRTPERMEVEGHTRVLPEPNGVYDIATGKRIG
ncbi:MAG TPA: MBL fold metallo-hydrolase [Symbiobacteriaceae bacterium]|nr:MBL fold metallo-hydrolase [Symbiobacteriaceae bacterium]